MKKNLFPIICAIAIILIFISVHPILLAPLTQKDFVVSLNGGSEKKDMIYSLLNDGDESGYFYYDPSRDDSKESVIKTRRGIVLGDSKEAVLKKYGEIESRDFGDYYCEFLIDYCESNGLAEKMNAECSTYVSYTYYDFDMKWFLTFYFDENDELTWIGIENDW